MDEEFVLGVIGGTIEGEGIEDFNLRFSRNGIGLYIPDRLIFVPRPRGERVEELEGIGKATADFLKPSTHPDLNTRVRGLRDKCAPFSSLRLSLKKRSCTMEAMNRNGGEIKAYPLSWYRRPDEFFLLSYLHELAHVVCFNKRSVPGHSVDWKVEYARQVERAIDLNLFSDPQEILSHLETAPRFAITLRKSEL